MNSIKCVSILSLLWCVSAYAVEHKSTEQKVVDKQVQQKSVEHAANDSRVKQNSPNIKKAAIGHRIKNESSAERKKEQVRQSVTLEDALESAFFYNTSLEKARTQKKSADIKYDQSELAFLPSAKAVLKTSRANVWTHSYNHDTENRFGMNIGYTENRAQGMNTRTEMQVQMTQNLFSGFSTINGREAAKVEANAAFHALRFREQELILNVVKAYTEIWSCVRKVDALKKAEENYQKALVYRQNMLDAGTSTPAEVAGAHANYQSAVYKRIDAERELFSAESSFEIITGVRADRNIDLPDLELNLPESLEKLIKQSTVANNSIIYNRLMAEVAQKKLSIAKGRLAPSVDATLEAGRTLSKYPRKADATSNISASLSVTIPIFENSNGSNAYSSIDLANQEVLGAKVEYENTVLDIHNKCVKAWNSYIAAGAMIKAGRSTVKSRELSSESVLEGLALGMKSNVDVLTEEEKLLEARIDLAKSQKTKIDAAVELLMLRGDLSAESFIARIRARDKQKLQKTQKKIGNYIKKMSYSPREIVYGE